MIFGTKVTWQHDGRCLSLKRKPEVMLEAFELFIIHVVALVSFVGKVNIFNLVLQCQF
jgi:hypothetical protein